MAVLMFFLGGLIVGSAVLLWERVVQAEKKRRDAQEYKSLWSEAVNLLASNGQLTDEQIKKITPSKVTTAKLPRGEGLSSHRMTIEIDRAKHGMSPADNLQGMLSSHIMAVQQARIKHGTTE